MNSTNRRDIRDNLTETPLTTRDARGRFHNDHATVYSIDTDRDENPRSVYVHTSAARHTLNVEQAMQLAEALITAAEERA
ncbi:hypothetical protein ACT3TD_12245 [Corynebacterium sp. AOP36-E1-14]|uniref:hypothetical protein n=1 Tax=Corynebacterium sp. AOP36-E1-14 TaxID=3457682 RepID=UPI004033979F